MTTATQRASAKLMLDKGYPLESVAAFFNVKIDTVRAWHDPEFAALQQKKFKERSFKRSKGWK